MDALRRRLPHSLYSLSKSFTSTAVGTAVAEGKLSLDDEVLKLFPDEAPAQPSGNLRAMRIRGAWTGEDTFAARPVFTETPFIFTIRLKFSGDEVHCEAESNVGFWPLKQAPLVGKAR